MATMSAREGRSDVSFVVAVGPGPAHEMPVGVVALLREYGVGDLSRLEPGCRQLLTGSGVDHDPASATLALSDRDALALLRRGGRELASAPDLETIEGRVAAAELAALWQVTRRLRRECPWDREQTAATIVPHTLEEAYEVADAVADGGGAKLVDELGDLLFQTYFLALLSHEQGTGDLADVAVAIREKLIRRHPHVYGEPSDAVDSAGEVRGLWEQIKRESEGREGIFHDVPGVLPALLHARKLQRRASAVGFDWAEVGEAWPKIAEEVGELADALAVTDWQIDGEPGPALVHEAGDVLFSVVNVLRLAEVDPELALRAASTRFRQRVETAEALAEDSGEDFSTLELAAQEVWYQRAKDVTPDSDTPPR